MKNLIIIDTTLPFASHLLNYTLETITNNQNSAEILFDKIKKLNYEVCLLLPKADHRNIKYLSTLADKHTFKKYTAKNDVHNNADLLKELYSFVKEFDVENIGLVFIDGPLLDLQMTNLLYQSHIENVAEYTFGDNFVDGLVPEIMTKDFLEKISEYPYKRPDVLSRKVFDCIDADINKFFIELEVAEYDFSMLRIELLASNKRNFNLIKKLLQYTQINDGYKTFYEQIKKHPEILFVFSKYVEIGITNKNNLKVIFSPMQKINRNEMDMDLNLFKKIVDELSNEYQDIIISFSLWGEPLLHPQFFDFVDYAIKENKIFNLIIETNGLMLDNEVIKKLSEYPLNKLIFIFKLNSLNPETFLKLYPSSNIEELNKIKENIINFISFNEFNKYRTFIEINKIQENNIELEDFYNFWQNKGVNIIIQKFNSYLGLLEDKSVVDLTPLDRIPCWHLQRDLEIFSNGDIPMCKQDITIKNKLGNINDNNMLNILKNLEKYYLLNFNEDFEKLPMCKNCDEWYTYNF